MVIVSWVGNLRNVRNWGNVVVGNGSNELSHWNHSLDNLMGQRFTADNSVESIVFVSGVVHNATESIGINQGILSNDVVTVTFFLLALDISGRVIVHRVRELIFGRSFCVFHVFDGNGQNDCAGNSHQGEESQELEINGRVRCGLSGYVLILTLNAIMT